MNELRAKAIFTPSDERSANGGIKKTEYHRKKT